ncbi:MAG: hypothetical protein A2286_14050 [Gammaproteobacteria bacterium RIFOXYA12_FULL_61_12]|nr:MAG: hypothetical protein A2514_11910 [Gammaproteobacteria bacterium RIFOXYD12_FULL_61_37]OGT94066.1 MAG: hypothetical protein A2286_14050 [Gammaproteobacteria bacterium RIFOXYA12_FULL_61_12]
MAADNRHDGRLHLFVPLHACHLLKHLMLEGWGAAAYTSRQPDANGNDVMINIRYEPNDVVVRIPKELSATAYILD